MHHSDHTLTALSHLVAGLSFGIPSEPEWTLSSPSSRAEYVVYGIGSAPRAGYAKRVSDERDARAEARTDGRTGRAQRTRDAIYYGTASRRLRATWRVSGANLCLKCVVVLCASGARHWDAARVVRADRASPRRGRATPLHTNISNGSGSLLPPMMVCGWILAANIDSNAGPHQRHRHWRGARPSCRSRSTIMSQHHTSHTSRATQRSDSCGQ